MKIILLLLFCISLLFSCTKPPEQYVQGIAEKNDKNYVAAIKNFLLVPKEEKDYKDSATKQIVYCIDSLASLNLWSEINKQLILVQIDSSAYQSSKEGIVTILEKFVKDGKWQSVLIALDTLEHGIIKPESVKKIRFAAEDNALSGIWRGIGKIKNKIKFERVDSVSKGICVVNHNGWAKNMIIYKNVRYEGNGIWDVNPKIFKTRFGYNAGTYFSKKRGSITFIGLDTIEINYERAVRGTNKLKFVREINDKDFDTFWKEFKQALFANDKDKLCAMTNFPLEYGQQHQISDAEYDMEPEKQTKEEFLKQEYTPFGDEYVINSIKDQEATVERKDNYITCSFTTENGSLMLKFELIDGKYKLVYYEHWQFS